MILMTLSFGFAARSEHRWRQKRLKASPRHSLQGFPAHSARTLAREILRHQ